MYRSRYALWKNPENLTAHQQQQLEWIAKTDPRLWRTYPLKEGLRVVFALKGDAGEDALDRWISWARRCRIDAFVALQRRIVKHRPAIDAALDSGLSNALIESTYTKIRVITASLSGSTAPKPSSPSPCSASAATHRSFPAGTIRSREDAGGIGTLGRSRRARSMLAVATPRDLRERASWRGCHVVHATGSRS